MVRHSPSAALFSVRVLRDLPSSALLWGAGAQALALFCPVVGCLCTGARPLTPCCGLPLLRHSPSSTLLRGPCAQPVDLF